MSFKYGASDTASLAGVTATLEKWPSLGTLGLDTSQIEGQHGRNFFGATIENSSFEFDVIISGDSAQEVFQRRDNFVGALDPERGPRPLVVEFDTLWQWENVMVSGGIEWERFGWERGSGFNLRGTVSFETVGKPSAREVTPQSVPFSGSTLFTLSRGNTSTIPKLVFNAANPAGQDPWTVKIGSFTLSIASGIATGLRASLDWESWDFDLINSSGARVASLVPFMSHYRRPTLAQGVATSVSVDKAGVAATGCVLYPNNRRN